jgi:hypothetical protein
MDFNENASRTRERDRRQIEATLHRYVRGVDRRNWNLFRSAYHHDAHDNHGDFEGDVDALVHMIAERHATIKQSMHVLHAIIIEFAGEDQAAVETQFTVVQTLGAEAEAYRSTLASEPLSSGEDLQVQIYGRYVDRFTFRNGNWRIADRTVVIEHSSVAKFNASIRPGWVMASRNGDDAIERLRTSMNLPPFGSTE